MRRALVLWANDSSPNLGVRALAEGTAALVRRALGPTEVSFHHHGRTDGPAQFRRVRSLVRENVTREHGFVEWLRSFDVVVDTRSGDSFTDIYGSKRHLMMTALGETCVRAGVPYVLGPQTVGPFESRQGRLLARRTMRTARCVMARDSQSADQAGQLGRGVDVLTTDVVFALEPPAPDTDRDVVLNVSGLLWHPGPHVDAARYREAVVGVYRGLVERGRRVALLAHVIDSPHLDNDVPAVRELAEQHAPEAELIMPEGLDDVRAALAGADLVIGARMHACLNALSVGVPAIAMAYSKKFAPLLADVGWPHSVDLRGHDDAASAVLDIVDAGADAGADDLADQARQARDRARARLDVAVKALRDVVPPQP